MKLLVTGGAGFIGSAVVRNAISQGFEVVNLDVLTYAACLENLDAVAHCDGYVFEQVDICDRAALDLVFAKHTPDAVMHLAAESHVDRSIDGPGDFIETNIMGTYHLLEAARAYWLKAGRPLNFRFHHISTDEVFGSLPEDKSVRFREETPYDPRSPYSASKAASDHLVRAWGRTYGLPILITNCSNNYGPCQFPEKLVPVVILKAIHGESIPVYGKGDNIRDWLYVDDHANALLTVLAKGKLGETYNIGGNNERTNLELIRTICRIIDEKGKGAGQPTENLITFVKDRPGHDLRYAIDASKLNRALSWRPSVTIEEGLSKTIDWYLNSKDWLENVTSGSYQNYYKSQYK